MKLIVSSNKGQEFILKSIFTLAVISLGLQLITADRHSWLFWVVAVLFIILIVLLVITRDLRTPVNSLTVDDGTLIIRWYNRLRKTKIRMQDIAEINDEKKCISIKLKNNRVFRIPVNTLEVKDQHDMRNFMKETTGS
jgi:hypothetical protein